MKNGTIETIDDLAKVAELMFENSGLSAAVGIAVRNDLARIVKAAADDEVDTTGLTEEDFKDLKPNTPESVKAETAKNKPPEPPRGTLGKIWDNTPDSVKLVGAVTAPPIAWGAGREVARAAGGLPNSGYLANAWNTPFRAAKGVANLGGNVAKGVFSGSGAPAASVARQAAASVARQAAGAAAQQTGGLFSAAPAAVPAAVTDAAAAVDPVTKTMGYRAGSLGKALMNKGVTKTVGAFENVIPGAAKASRAVTSGVGMSSLLGMGAGDAFAAAPWGTAGLVAGAGAGGYYAGRQINKAIGGADYGSFTDEMKGMGSVIRHPKDSLRDLGAGMFGNTDVDTSKFGPGKTDAQREAMRIALGTNKPTGGAPGQAAAKPAAKAEMREEDYPPVEIKSTPTVRLPHK